MRRVLVLVSVLVSAAAQQASPAICGTVRGLDGRPCGGAHVRFVPWVEPGCPVPIPTEVLAGADGRFQASLGDATGLSIWAWSERLASPIVEAVAHVPDVMLPLEPIGGERLTVRGLDAWRDEGPLRAAVLVPAHGPWSASLDLDGQGAGTLPACPPGDLVVDLRTSRDELLARVPVERGPGGATATLLPPVVVPIVVRDDSGGPLAGAVVRHRAAKALELPHDSFPIRSSAVWRQVGVSDAEGRVTARLPLPCDPMRQSDDSRLECEFAVALPGHALGWAGFSGGAFAGGAPADLDDGVLAIPLRAQEPATVRVLADGKPVAGLAVRLLSRSLTSELGGLSLSFRMAEWQTAATTGADGVATFHELPWEASELRLVPGGAGASQQTFVPVPVGRVPEVDLTRGRRVCLRVVDAEGRPVAGVRGLAMAAVPDVMLLEPRGYEPRFGTDAAGVANVWLGDGVWWVWVSDGERFAHAAITVGAAPAAGPLELRLQPLARWCVKVANPDGTPAVGARFALGGGEWIDGTPIPPVDELRPLQYANDFDFRLVKIGRADRDGRLTLRFLPPTVAHTFGQVVLGDLRSEELRLVPARLPATLVLRRP